MLGPSVWVDRQLFCWLMVDRERHWHTEEQYSYQQGNDKPFI